MTFLKQLFRLGQACRVYARGPKALDALCTKKGEVGAEKGGSHDAHNRR